VFGTASESVALEGGEFAVQSTQQSGVGSIVTVVVLTGPESRGHGVKPTLLARVRWRLDGVEEVTVRAAKVLLAHVDSIGADHRNGRPAKWWGLISGQRRPLLNAPYIVVPPSWASAASFHTMTIAEQQTESLPGTEGIADDVTDLVGATPLVHLPSVGEHVYGKLESFNPGGSVKDRIGVAMIDRAEEAGHIGPGTTIVEPTSGNTGNGLALAAAAREYDLILTMPASMSEERRSLMAALGAELVLTPADGGMGGAIERADEIAGELKDAFVPQQFQNLANPWIHRETTGPEIWADTNGEIDVFVAGVGTGGTITGVSEYLKEDRGADVQSIAVEPADSAVLSGEEAGSHGIQGIGAGFVPDVLRTELLDAVETVEREDAVSMARQLAAEEGVLAGLSSGGAVEAARRVASRPEHQDDTIVVVLPDTGERYLSTDLFE
jgi:cysteine synthase A